MLDALARFIDRRRRAVLAGAVALIAVAGVLGGPVVGLLDSDDDFEDPASESVVARDAVERATGRSAAPDLVALVRLGAPVDQPPAQARLRRVTAALRDRDVAQVLAYRTGPDPGPPELLSRDRRSTYVVATFRSAADEDAVAERLQQRLGREPGVVVGGGVVGEGVAPPEPRSFGQSPCARLSIALPSAVGKSGAYCSMSAGTWLAASRSVASECLQASILPSDW